MIKRVIEFLRKETLLVAVVILGVVFFAFAFAEHNGDVLAEGQFKHNVIVENLGEYEIIMNAGETALDALRSAGEENGFEVRTVDYDFGMMVTKIGEREGDNNNFWGFYLNDVMAEAGASDITLKEGDETEWKYEKINY